eukprot:364734-Chlamydomonas_euryale.AAC.10
MLAWGCCGHAKQSSEPAAEELVLLSEMINQTVGDALSGLLLVETVTRRKQWSFADWEKQYKELPSRQIKLKVQLACATCGAALARCTLEMCMQAGVGGCVVDSPESTTDCPHLPTLGHRKPHVSMCQVVDRTVITTEDAERRCVTPAGLQAAIDEVVARYPTGSRQCNRPNVTSRDSHHQA